MIPTDPDTIKRGMKLREMTAEMLANMTPQERDRMLQRHLAQARGPQRNAMLLRKMTATMLRARRHAEDERRHRRKQACPMICRVSA